MGTSPSGVSGPVSLSTCHMQVQDTQGMGTTQVRICGQPGRASPHAWHHTGTKSMRTCSLPDNELESLGTWMFL